MLGIARITPSRKTAPMAPEMRMDASTPRGACRLASMVSSPNVPAVSNPYTMNNAMNMPRRNAGK